ncbi:TIGR04141 family sporadically distributed protein [Saccharothrix isguenensis]
MGHPAHQGRADALERRTVPTLLDAISRALRRDRQPVVPACFSDHLTAFRAFHRTGVTAHARLSLDRVTVPESFFHPNRPVLISACTTGPITAPHRPRTATRPLGSGSGPLAERSTRTRPRRPFVGHCRTTQDESFRIRTRLARPKEFLAAVNTTHDIIEPTAPPRRLTGIRTLTADDPLLPALERRLAAALGGSTQFGPLDLRWPAAAVARAGDTVAFRTNDVGGYGPVPLDPMLDIGVITARFARIPEFARTDELKQARLIPCADENREELLTAPIPLDRWIAFETTLNGRSYRLREGRWHEISRGRGTA